MDIKQKAVKILDLLEGSMPNASIALRFSTPLELLIATILSAQCTDERVNLTTKTLFKKYTKAEDYTRVSQQELAEDVKSINFYNNKTKSIQKCARDLVTKFAGAVPATLKELVALPGVGAKTANVVLANAFNIPALAVDTHVKRVAKRIGLTVQTDPDKVEADLTKIILKHRWIDTTRLLILHGRGVCKARKPLCEICVISEFCDFFVLNPA